MKSEKRWVVNRQCVVPWDGRYDVIIHTFRRVLYLFLFIYEKSVYFCLFKKFMILVMKCFTFGYFIYSLRNYKHTFLPTICQEKKRKESCNAPQKILMINWNLVDSYVLQFCMDLLFYHESQCRCAM